MNYNLEQLYFSTAGSFLTLAANPQHRLTYRTSARRAMSEKWMSFWANEFYELALLDESGGEVSYTWLAQPHRVDLNAANGGRLALCFADPNTLLFEGERVRLRLLPTRLINAQYSPSPDQIHVIDGAAYGTHQFRAGDGTVLCSNGSGTLTFTVAESDAIRGAFRFSPYECRWTNPLPDFQASAAKQEQDFAAWLERMPPVPETYRETAEQALYLLWSSRVPVGGPLTRPTIFSSKASMNSIWAWDNCFHALALARIDPELAWDQLHLFFDHQDPYGMIPDMINDRGISYGFAKPPIYGWTIRKLTEIVGLEAALPHLVALYGPICRQTEWWFSLRDFDGDGLCQYHNGNDSGWDNATLFDVGCPVDGADLAAHLILQMEGLAFAAEALGKNVEAEKWKARAQDQLGSLLSRWVKDQRFFSPRTGESDAPPCQSLLNTIPLLLGQRLPEAVQAALIADVSPDGPFLTAHGLASEAPTSPKYEADGYWRGPIWAPPAYLIVEGLRDLGQTSLARTLAEGYCAMVRNAPGFWENYDALSGRGLRCPGIGWTAAVFLMLAAWLNEPTNNAQNGISSTSSAGA